MSHEYYILFYSIVFTYPIVNPRSHESESKPPKRIEPKPRRESNPKLVQRFRFHAALYPLSYREVVAIKHKMALKNPRRHLRQNRSESYFAVNGKIYTTFKKITQLVQHLTANGKIDTSYGTGTFFILV